MHGWMQNFFNNTATSQAFSNRETFELVIRNQKLTATKLRIRDYHWFRLLRYNFMLAARVPQS